MTAVETTPVYPSYAHPLLSWGSVILGAVAAIAVGVLLNLLVAVFDATAVLHDLAKNGEGGDHAALLGVFGGLANLIALFIGGFIAARSANHPDHHDGMLHGLAVWALSFVAAFAILGAGANKTVGVAFGGEAGGPAAAQAMTGAEPNSQSVPTGAAAGTAAGAATDATTAPPPPFVATPAQQQAAEADAQAEIQSEAHDIAKAAAETAFWAFAAMLIGLGAALWGGVVGSRHPEHFVGRPRRVIVVS